MPNSQSPSVGSAEGRDPSMFSRKGATLVPDRPRFTARGRVHPGEPKARAMKGRATASSIARGAPLARVGVWSTPSG